MNSFSVTNQELITIIDELLNQHKDVKFKVVGTSMLPFFKHLETSVTLRKKEDYFVNDVILFKYHDEYRLHRIRKIKGKQVVVIGDNLLSKEDIQKEDILGSVVSYSKGMKEVLVQSLIYRIKVFIWLLVKPFGVRIMRRCRHE
mgnify:CR=1 FL=1